MSNTSWCDFFFWVTQNVTSIWAVKLECICVFMAGMSPVNHYNWWYWAVTWVWDTCDSVSVCWAPASPWRLKLTRVVLWSVLLVVSWYVCARDIRHSVLNQSVRQWVLWPLPFSPPLIPLSYLFFFFPCVCPQQSACEEMLRELQGIVLCQDGLHARRRRAASAMRPRPLPLEERRTRAATVSLSNGKLCGGTGLPEPLSHRLAQEAALVARGCSHIRICPECRRFQGLRMRPAAATGALSSPTHSDESIEWDKTTNSSEPE